MKFERITIWKNPPSPIQPPQLKAPNQLSVHYFHAQMEKAGSENWTILKSNKMAQTKVDKGSCS